MASIVKSGPTNRGDQTMKLQPNERLLTGSWNYINNVMQADDVCRRIEWLVGNDLRNVASSPT
jgi:hypothetical protein